MSSSILKYTAAILVFTLLAELGQATLKGHGDHGHHDKGHDKGHGWGHTEVKGHGHHKGHDNHGWGHQEAKGEGWANYKFGYGVGDEHTGDWKSAYETRQDGWTKGTYSLLQPDGVVRTVNYEADPWNGFKATVHNKGWANHPKGHGWGEHKAEKKPEGWTAGH